MREDRIPRLCSDPLCGRIHFGRGLCKRHYDTTYRAEYSKAYQNERYRNDPKFKEEAKKRSKATYLANPEIVSIRAKIWRAKNPEKAKQIAKRIDAKAKERAGVSRTARYVPGKPCAVHAGGREVWGEVAAPAFRERGVWRVSVRLPWGECVIFNTSELRFMGEERKAA